MPFENFCSGYIPFGLLTTAWPDVSIRANRYLVFSSSRLGSRPSESELGIILCLTLWKPGAQHDQLLRNLNQNDTSRATISDPVYLHRHLEFGPMAIAERHQGVRSHR